jgi:hypothetical protein
MRPRRLGLARALGVLAAFVAMWALFMGAVWLVFSWVR